ncbi:hypothetical protein OPQ81_004536 [Rhizoctonia solani]|nr:hypothetical protein OPQ81_004536 [Rhizoctonia solani]
MSPLIGLHTRTLLDTQSSASALTSSMPGRVVFILCIVFGSLLGCIAVAMSIFFARRHKRRKRDTATLNMHREASFIAGTPSVLDIIPPPQPTRRPSARTTSRIVIPSPELGSVFHLDMLPGMARRASSMYYPTGRRTPGPRPRSGSAPIPQSPTPLYESLFSRTSTAVATPGPDKHDTPLRVLNPSHASTSTIGTQVQKPTPIYRVGFNSSRERLVSSASADSLFSGSTTTPPLSPSGTWSHSGTNRIDSPNDIISAAAGGSLNRPLNQQGALIVPCSPHIAVECFEMSPDLVDPELTPRAKHPLSPPLPLELRDPPLGATGSPVTLSRFPFRFSADEPSLPALPSITLDSADPSSHTEVFSPRRSQSHLSVPSHQVYGLGLNQSRSRQSLQGHSTPSLKLKIHHSASDEIIAIAFAPQTINFRAVSDAVRGRLGFEPQRIWSDDQGSEITDDSSLLAWLDDQYTKGHTRLMLHVE